MIANAAKNTKDKQAIQKSYTLSEKEEEENLSPKKKTPKNKATPKTPAFNN